LVLLWLDRIRKIVGAKPEPSTEKEEPKMGATMAKKKKVGRPPKPEGAEVLVRLEIKVPEWLMTKVDLAGRRRGLSRSAYVRQALIQVVAHDLGESTAQTE
jgi:hypothetical protein